MKTASPEMLAFAPNDFPEKIGPSYKKAVSDVCSDKIKGGLVGMHLDGKCSSLRRNWCSSARRNGLLTSCVGLDSRHEASVCSGFHRLSQDVPGPHCGRLEELRDHNDSRFR